MTALANTESLVFVLERLVLALAVCAALVFVFGLRRRSQASSKRQDTARSSLWPRLWVWLAISGGMLTASYLGGAVFALTLGAIGILAMRELATAGRAAYSRPGSFFLFIMMSAFWVAVPLVLLVHLRSGSGGFFLVTWIMLVVALSDVFAMFGGMAFGRTKLSPTISSGKTLEGLLSGLIGGLGAAATLRAGLPPDAATGTLGHELYYGTAAALVIAGLAGDLVASAVKRRAGLKDFSKALPGHGGVMDRLDSLLFAAPAGYAVIYFFW